MSLVIDLSALEYEQMLNFAVLIVLDSDSVPIIPLAQWRFGDDFTPTNVLNCLHYYLVRS